MGLGLAGVALAGSLSGTVRDEDGAPLRGIFVAAYDASLEQVAVDGPTGPDGRWTLEVPDGRIRLRAVPGPGVNRVEGWLPGDVLEVCASEVVPVEGSVGGVVFTLAPGGRVEGRIADEMGRPLGGARVEAVPAVSGGTLQPREALTDAQGRFELVGLPTDRAWRVAVSAEGWPDQLHPGVYDVFGASLADPGPDETVDLGPAALRPGVVVGGRVHGPEGPVEGAAVSAFVSPQLVRGTTDADGVYTIRGLPPGDAVVWASAPGLARTYLPDTASPGQAVPLPEDGEVASDLDLHLPRSGSLRGRVSGGGGPGTTVVAFTPDGVVGFGIGTTDDGSFHLPGLHPGPWVVRAGARPGLEARPPEDPEAVADGVRPVHIPEAGAAFVTLRLDPPATVGGTIRGASGAPLAGVRVVATARGTGEALQTWSGEDGTYALEGLPGGETWDLRAEDDAPCPEVDPGLVRQYHPGTPDPEALVGVALDGGEAWTWDVTMPSDVDRDGMDDAWEAAWGLDPTRPDGMEDPDGDGNVNLVEYWLDDDPLVGRSGCATIPGSAGGAVAILGLLVLARRRRGGAPIR